MTALAWYLTVGVVLCAMAITATLVQRLPLTTAVVYLPLGWFLGPTGTGVLNVDLVRSAPFIEQTAAVAILISLFAAGLKVRLPPTSRLWFLSFRLAIVSMVLTILAVVGVAAGFFGIPCGEALLLGGILAPTDPVLASDVEIADPFHLRPLQFGLTSEAGLNDGTAFPVVRLGLLLIAGPLSSDAGVHWFLVDVCWGLAAGVVVGAATGALVGRYVLHLRQRHGHAVGLGYFLAPGLIATSYASAEYAHAYGFVAVFSSAVALRWIEMRRTQPGNPPKLPLISTDSREQIKAATDPHTAPLFLVELLLQFTSQMEQLGEIIIVVIVGALVGPGVFDLSVLTPLLLLFFVIRPASVAIGLFGTPLDLAERSLIGWFGIRGIGSIYYLVYVINRGLPAARVPALANTVLAAVALSVVMHGLSVTPLMRWYSRRAERMLAA